MNCLPPKKVLLPPYLCWLIDSSYSSSSFAPHTLCTNLLLASHILTFTAHFSLSFSRFFWITNCFLSHFLPQKMFLVPFPKKKGIKKRPFLSFQWAGVQMCLIWPAIWGQVWLSKSRSLLRWHSWHPWAVGTGLVVLVPPQRQALQSMFSNQFQEVCCGIIWNQGFLIFFLL